jgi:predicted enzyme related to lactoylglutathione lyase
MPHHPDMGPPMWMAYLSVEDVDAAAARAAEAGGTVLFGPMDAGQVGRLAVIRDPQGAVLSLWRMNGGDSAPPDGMPPGAFCWETLMTSDLEGALAFYERVVGWRRGEFGGGPVFFAGEVSVADLQEAPPGTPPHWMSHIVVEDFAAARDEAEARGAMALVPEVDVPSVGRFAVIADPHGAVVSLFEPAPQE